MGPQSDSVRLQDRVPVLSPEKTFPFQCASVPRPLASPPWCCARPVASGGGCPSFSVGMFSGVLFKSVHGTKERGHSSPILDLKALNFFVRVQNGVHSHCGGVPSSGGLFLLLSTSKMLTCTFQYVPNTSDFLHFAVGEEHYQFTLWSRLRSSGRHKSVGPGSGVAASAGDCDSGLPGRPPLLA